jgi:TRAP-type C4-dicarboxylate transport system permease large subunit
MWPIIVAVWAFIWGLLSAPQAPAVLLLFILAAVWSVEARLRELKNQVEQSEEELLEAFQKQFPRIGDDND